jgi:hypothetical protein
LSIAIGVYPAFASAPQSPISCEEGALPGLSGGFDPQLVLASGGGVRFSGQEAGVQAGGFAAGVGGPAQCGAVRGLALAEQQVVGMALDRLAGLQAERFRAGAPPAAGRLAAGLAGLDVIAGRVLGRAAVDLFPYVVQVVTLAQRRDDCHLANPASAEVAEVPMLIA